MARERSSSRTTKNADWQTTDITLSLRNNVGSMNFPNFATKVSLAGKKRFHDSLLSASKI